MKQLKLKLILTVLTSMVCINAFSYDALIDGIYYNFYGDEAIVTYRAPNSNNRIAYQGNVVIPSSVNYNSKDYSVTSIDTYAFNCCYGLTSVTIPNSVTIIGGGAFSGCTGLTSIEIPNSVTSISNYAFSGCSGLKKVIVKDIAAWCGIKFDSFDSNPLCHAHHLYSDENTEITNLVIPNSVTSIGFAAFEGCSGLTSVTIGNSVTSIGSDAFLGCDALSSLTVSVNNPKYDSRENCNAIIETATNTLVVGIKSTVIPNSVTSISNYAFSGCSGLTSIEIPNSVTSIGDRAFTSCSGLTSIHVDDNNPKYDSRDNCNAIIEKETGILIAGCKKTVIPNSVTSIGDYAFYGCSGLTSIEIPNSVTSIGQDAFHYCSGLTSIEIPNSVTSIGLAAFGECTGLTSFRFPNQLETLSVNVLSDCKVKSIIIPASVKTIEQGAFVSCQQLEDVYCLATAVPTTHYLTFYNLNTKNVTLHVYAESVNAYSSANVWRDLKQVVALTPDEIATLLKLNILIDGLYYYLDKENHQAWVVPMPDGKYTGNIEIPDYIRYEGEVYSVTGIGKSAFEGCSGLTSIEIPNSVTSIGDRAFTSCSGLTSIHVDDNNPKYDSRDNCNAIIEKETGILIAGCKKTVIPNSVTSIGDYAFYGCSGLTSIEIPNSVTSIGSSAFYGCTGLKKVIVKDIAAWCGIKFDSFDSNPLCHAHHLYSDENTEITNLVIPNSVTNIGYWAFYGCTGLTSITIPNSVTNIGHWAFAGCSGLTSVTIPNSVTWIGDHTFHGCSSITSIEIPNSVTSIGYEAFAGCSGLTSIEIPNSVTSIGTSAFYYCSGLTSIEIPNSVTSIGFYAFENCSGLTSIEIPNSVTSIGVSPFAGCSGLTSIHVDERNPKYDSRNNCNAIIEKETNTLVAGCKNTHIPNSVTSIGEGAFLRCSGLTSIEIPNSVTSIGVAPFAGCSGLTSVKVYAKTPPVAGDYAFPVNDNIITLYVPQGSKAAYEAAVVWKDFSNIVEFEDIIKGDANGDGEVNVSDIVEIVNYIMNKLSDKFVFAAADLNEDGEVNVTDIVKVVSIIMSSSNNAPKRAAVAEMVDNDQLEMTSNDNHTLSLNLQNEGSYVASQFDVVLSAGQTLESIQLNSKRMENHQMTYAEIDDNRYKVVIYSLNNAAYKGQSGELLNIKVAGSGDVSVEDILFVTAGQMEKRFPPLHRGTTGISVITNEAETMDIYTIDGRLIRKQAKSTDGLEKGLYIINGKKQIVR